MKRPERIAPELEQQALDEAAAAEPGRTSTFAALEFRDFRLFWVGLLVSNIGTWMQQFGLGWLVVQLAIRDGTPHLGPLYLGLVGLARALPGLTFGLFGGVVADRADRRRLLILTQTSAAIVAATLAFLTIAERINIVEIVLLSAMNSIIFSFDAPTRQAMVPRLVPDRQLMSAIGLNSAAFNGATLVGPLVGGILIIPFGVGGLMLINAVSYLAIVVALLFMSPQPVRVARRPAMLDSIREGLAFIRHDPVLRWVVALTSFAVMVFMGMANTLMQTRTPDHLRGRAMSVHTMVFMGFMPLGQMLLGSVGTIVGIDRAFFTGGVIVVLLASYVALRVPAVRGVVATPRPEMVARSG